MLAREFSDQDLDRLVDLFNAYRVFYKKASDLQAAREFITQRLEKEDSKIYVCEDNEGKIIGFTQLYPLFSSTRMKKLWLLNDLFVDENGRGQGASKLLIDKAKELAKSTDACGVMLETGKTNHIGNNLYPRTGFVKNEGSNFYEWSV